MRRCLRCRRRILAHQEAEALVTQLELEAFDICCSEKKSRDHVIVSSGWWSHQAGRVEGGGSGTRS
jgi:hypothetical protein